MRLSLVVAISVCLSSNFAFAEPIRFEPRIGEVEHQYVGGWEHFVGGGVATFDCNNDRLPDLFVAGGSAPSKLLINKTDVNGSLAFADQTPDTLAVTSATGGYPIDIDSDGHKDLVVLRVGENKMFKGNGNCQFEPFEAVNLSSDDRWTTAFSATWEKNQNLPTLAFGNYVDRANPDGPFGACDTNQLYRPNNQHYDQPIELAPGHCALSMLISDWGRKGIPDLRISNDRHYYLKDGQEQLWSIGPEPQQYGIDDGWVTHKLWGMGIASRDISGDGLPEIYLTSMGDQKLHSLSTDDPIKPSYSDAAYKKGITTHRPYMGDDGRPSTGWHVEFGDVQNDGLDDIFVAKGNVDQMISSAMADPNSLLVQQTDGRFVEQGDTANVGNPERSRGAALVDLNLDGKLDLVVINRRANMEIHQNVTADTGNWIGLSLKQPAPNLDAIGAWIEIDTGERTIAREITIGGGHASGALVPQHFGLGAHKNAKLRIIWPDGQSSSWQEIEAQKYWVVERQGNDFRASAY